MNLKSVLIRTAVSMVVWLKLLQMRNTHFQCKDKIVPNADKLPIDYLIRQLLPILQDPLTRVYNVLLKI